MKKLINIIKFPFSIMLMIFAGIVIIWHEEKEYRQSKKLTKTK